jgi:hypothetical protein
MTLAPMNLLKLNFSELGTNDMVVMLGTVADQVEVHPGYQQLPDYVFGPIQFRALASELHQADQDAANRDNAKIALKNAKMLECAVALTAFGQFAIMKTLRHKDTSYIENIGFQRQNTNNRLKKTANQGPIGYSNPFSVRQEPVSGAVKFKAGKVPGAAHYDVYMCIGDPNNESCWILAATFINTRHMRIEGLQPGTIYHFRVRCLGANGYGPWSNIIKIMVV